MLHYLGLFFIDMFGGVGGGSDCGKSETVFGQVNSHLSISMLVILFCLLTSRNRSVQMLLCQEFNNAVSCALFVHYD